MTRMLQHMFKGHGGHGVAAEKQGCQCHLPEPPACSMSQASASMREGDGLRPLQEFPAGSTVTIDGINGGHKLRCRLLAMGLTPGTIVRVGATSCGGCCLRVRDANLFLGQGMSEKVLARPSSADSGADRTDLT